MAEPIAEAGAEPPMARRDCALNVEYAISCGYFREFNSGHIARTTSHDHWGKYGYRARIFIVNSNDPQEPVFKYPYLINEDERSGQMAEVGSGFAVGNAFRVKNELHAFAPTLEKLKEKLHGSKVIDDYVLTYIHYSNALCPILNFKRARTVQLFANQRECPVCLEKISLKSRATVRLDCGHVIHEDCVPPARLAPAEDFIAYFDRVLVQDRNRFLRHFVCPLCRAPDYFCADAFGDFNLDEGGRYAHAHEYDNYILIPAD